MASDRWHRSYQHLILQQSWNSGRLRIISTSCLIVSTSFSHVSEFINWCLESRPPLASNHAYRIQALAGKSTLSVLILCTAAGRPTEHPYDTGPDDFKGKPSSHALRAAMSFKFHPRLYSHSETGRRRDRNRTLVQSVLYCRKTTNRQHQLNLNSAASLNKATLWVRIKTKKLVEAFERTT